MKSLLVGLRPLPYHVSEFSQFFTSVAVGYSREKSRRVEERGLNQLRQPLHHRWPGYVSSSFMYNVNVNFCWWVRVKCNQDNVRGMDLLPSEGFVPATVYKSGIPYPIEEL